MNGDFWAVMIFLLVGGLVLSPVINLFLSINIRRRQQELANDLARLKSAVESLHKNKGISRPATESTQHPKSASSVAQSAPAPSSFNTDSLDRFIDKEQSKQTALAASSSTLPSETKSALASSTASPTQTKSQKPIVPRKPNPFELAARRILLRIWNWIIVGEEFRKPGTSVEYAVATNWLVRVGVLIVVIGVGFFLDYSSTRGWLGPLGKVSIALLTGSALLFTGIRLLDRKYHLIAQGLLGAGLATWYAAIFAAANMYEIVGVTMAFALMAAVTAGAGFMAVKFNSILVAILGIIGGYGTPVMLSTGDANFVGLYSYMLLLGIGVLGIARYRNWHLLNALAFLATYGLVAASLDSGYAVENFWEVLPFLVAFFVLFSTVIFIFQVWNAQSATLIELIMLILNAALFFGFSFALVREALSQEWCAGITLGLAAFYIVHLYVFMQRKIRDRGLSLGFIALAAFFLIVTLPLILSDQWLTFCWSLQALVLLWLAGKLSSRFLRYVAYGLYLIVFARFFALDMHSTFAQGVPQGTTLLAYLQMFAVRLISFGAPVLSVALAMRLIHKPVEKDKEISLEPENDIKPLFGEQKPLLIAAAVGFAMLFLYLHLEINRTLLFLYAPLRLPMLSLLWVGASYMLVLLFLHLRHIAILALALLFVAGALAKLFLVDIVFWDVSVEHFRYAVTDAYSWLDAGMRLLDFGVILAFLVYGFRLLQGQQKEINIARQLFGYGSIILLLVYTTLEVNSFFAHFVPGLRAGALSVYWGIFALALVTGGLLKRVRPLRLSGLGLFVLVALKIFFSDLALLDPLYKIIAFILLGGVLLAGAFVYLRFQDRFLHDESQTKHKKKDAS